MIPQQIHQIFFSFNGSKIEDFPLFQHSIESMKEKNPNFSHKLWTEKSVEDAIVQISVLSVEKTKTTMIGWK